MKAYFSPFALILLAACAPEPPPPVYVAPPPLNNGLTEREPDTCGMSKVQHLRGQPGTAVATAGIDRAYRVIPPRGLVTQEYNAQRIDFFLDDTGLIARISCG